MKIFHNGYEWWVAEDMAHLEKLMLETYGITPTDDDAEGDGWREWPADKKIHVHDEDEPEALELLPAEWIARNGPGLLCSTEY